MAQLKQCPNGHYFDSSMYPSCPYCSGASTGIDRTVGTFESYGIKTSKVDRPSSGSFYSGESGMGDTLPPTTGGFDKAVNGSGDTVPPEDYSSHTSFVRPGSRRKNDRGVTMSFQDSGSQGGQEYELPERYVVGWLVAVEGPYIGKSFEIFAGNTYIGQSEGDIVLKKDEFISKSKNANTIYDERENCFLLAAGQSRNLIRVNNKVLPTSSSIELKPYDLIEMGISKFCFVPFCSEQFQW